MILLHTADWHLGQTFFEYDRKAEHVRFLQWLREQVKVHGVDVLLVAGDVFDSPNPSAQAQQMYYRFLFEITAENPSLQIIIIAGNHDSAARLEAPNPLLENLRITVRGVVRRNEQGEIDLDYLIVPLDKGGCCLAVPYLRQGDYPAADTYTQGVRQMYEALFERVKGERQPVIALGHLQATGSEISQTDRSERTVIGGLECVSPDSFSPEILYTALGHLHRGQRVSGRENVRYAGAPLPMSFAEKNNKQGAVLIAIPTNPLSVPIHPDAPESLTIERLAFEPPVQLLSIPKEPLPLEEVFRAIEALPKGAISETAPYLEIKVLISEPEPSLRYQIEKALEGKAVRLARLVAVTPKRETQAKEFTYEKLQTIHPLEMADDIFKRKYGGEEMPDKMKRLLKSVIEEVER